MKKIIIYFTLMLLSIFSVSCGNNGNLSAFLNSSVTGVPSAPTGLTLQTATPSNISTPIVRVAGVASGNTVNLFTDNTCLTAAGTSIASGTTIDITATALSVDGTYHYYANTSNISGTSACSSATVAFQFVLVVTGGAVTAVYPTNGANWNDYITNSGGTSAFTRNDTACDYSGTGYFSCLHAGELRKFTATGQSSCTGLTAADDLQAFDWICDGTTNPVTFYSKGFAAGKGLRNLVTATDWISNKVTVTGAQALPVLVTPFAKWWTNPVGALPANPDPVADNAELLSTAGQVYTLAASASTSGYDVTADNISVVTLGTAVLTHNGSTDYACIDNGNTGRPSVICVNDYQSVTAVNNVWIEAKVDANNTAQFGIYLNDNTNSGRVHGSEARNANTFFGLYVKEASKNALVDYSNFSANTMTGFWDAGNGTTVLHSSFSGNAGDGLNTDDGANFYHRVYYDVMAANNGSAGISVQGGSGNFSLVRSTAVNNGSAGSGGIAIQGPYGNVLAVSSAQNNGAQLSWYNYNSAPDVNFVNIFTSGSWVLSGSNTGTCLVLASIDGSNSSANTDEAAVVSDLVVTHCSTGISAGANQVFTDSKIRVGQNQTDCEMIVPLDGGGNPVTVTNPTFLADCHHGATASTAALTGADPASTFVGFLSTNDSANFSSQTAGVITAPVGNWMATDWLYFTNFYRNWAFAGIGLFNDGQNGYCSGSCQLVDWSLAASDTLLKNGMGTAFTASAACPTAVDASNAANVIVPADSAGNGYANYLRAAVEVMDPVLNPGGNFNGVCESGETCIYTPNVGSYQGSGTLDSSATCTFTGGNGVTSVKLIAYPTNGI